MENGRREFTKGKKYKIERIDARGYYFIDDTGDLHSMGDDEFIKEIFFLGVNAYDFAMGIL